VGNDPEFGKGRELILETHACFAGLVRGVSSGGERDAEPDLGGKLFWAGALDRTGRALVMAGNVAGAATLVATADKEAQRRAIHAGTVDFLVTSLDEALRILKNEVRKRATVAVCVGSSAAVVEAEISARGVEPDLFRDGVVRASRQEREDRGGASGAEDAPELVAWKVEAVPAVWLPKLDATALACLRPEEAMARRWIRLSARYLGRIGNTQHLVWSDRGFRMRFVERVREDAWRGSIAVRGEIEAAWPGGSKRFGFGTPAEPR